MVEVCIVSTNGARSRAHPTMLGKGSMRQLGKLDIPQEAFIEALKMGSEGAIFSFAIVLNLDDWLACSHLVTCYEAI